MSRRHLAFSRNDADNRHPESQHAKHNQGGDEDNPDQRSIGRHVLWKLVARNAKVERLLQLDHVVVEDGYQMLAKHKLRQVNQRHVIKVDDHLQQMELALCL